MMQRVFSAASLAAVMLSAGVAQAQDACAPLNRVIAAADATPAWRGVAHGATGSVRLLGLTRCYTSNYSSSADYVCTGDGTAATIDARYQALVRDAGQCLTGQPSVRVEGVSTYTSWRTPEGVEVTAVKVNQANANNFGLGVTVRRTF